MLSVNLDSQRTFEILSEFVFATINLVPIMVKNLYL